MARKQVKSVRATPETWEFHFGNAELKTFTDASISAWRAVQALRVRVKELDPRADAHEDALPAIAEKIRKLTGLIDAHEIPAPKGRTYVILPKPELVGVDGSQAIGDLFCVAWEFQEWQFPWGKACEPEALNLPPEEVVDRLENAHIGLLQVADQVNKLGLGKQELEPDAPVALLTMGELEECLSGYTHWEGIATEQMTAGYRRSANEIRKDTREDYARLKATPGFEVLEGIIKNEGESVGIDSFRRYIIKLLFDNTEFSFEQIRAMSPEQAAAMITRLKKPQKPASGPAPASEGDAPIEDGDAVVRDKQETDYDRIADYIGGLCGKLMRHMRNKSGSNWQEIIEAVYDGSPREWPTIKTIANRANNKILVAMKELKIKDSRPVFTADQKAHRVTKRVS